MVYKRTDEDDVALVDNNILLYVLVINDLYLYVWRK